MIKNIFRPTLLAIALILAASSGFMEAQDSSVQPNRCPINARVFKDGQSFICLVVKPVSRKWNESLDSYVYRGARHLSLVESVIDLINMRIIAHKMNQGQIDASQLESMRSMANSVCKRNFCDDDHFHVNFPPKGTSSPDLLEMLIADLDASIPIQARAYVVDASYPSRIKKMQYAIALLISRSSSNIQYAQR